MFRHSVNSSLGEPCALDRSLARCSIEGIGGHDTLSLLISYMLAGWRDAWLGHPSDSGAHAVTLVSFRIRQHQRLTNRLPSTHGAYQPPRRYHHKTQDPRFLLTDVTAQFIKRIEGSRPPPIPVGPQAAMWTSSESVQSLSVGGVCRSRILRIQFLGPICEDCRQNDAPTSPSSTT